MSTDLSQRDQAHSVPAPVSESQVERLTEAISRSQHNYRELIDNLDQALFTLSVDGEVRVANLRLSEILGASFQELIGRRLSEFIASPTMEEVQRGLPALLKTGTWSGTIPVWLKRDKVPRHFDCWLQAAVEGETTSIIGWARDVTQQHESEVRFRELFESFREGILVVTPGGQLLDANPALVRILGYGSKDELQAVNFREMYADPSDRDAVIREIEAKGAMHDREIVMRRKDGKHIHCLASGFAMRDASGRPIRMHGTLIDITERREMERRLQQEQSFIRRIVASFPEMIAVLDREGRFIYVSDHVERVLGWPASQYVGRDFGTRSSEEDKAKLHRTFQRIVRGEDNLGQVEFRSPHADGSSRDLLLTARPFFDDDGKISGLVTCTRDITERKRMEEALRDSEERVRLMVEGVTDYAIFMLDPDGRVASWNRGAERIKGYEANDIIGKHFSVFYMPEDVKSGKPALELKVAKAEGQSLQEGWRLRKDGSRFLASSVITAVRDQEGRLRGFSKITRDITERHEMERKLQQEQEFARRLIECFPDLIVVLDHEGRFKFVSERIKDILGVSPEEYIGRSIGQRIGPEDRAKVTEMFQDLISGRKRQEQIEMRAQHTDGSWRTLRVIGSPLLDGTGKIVGMVSSGRDVTESRQLEQQLAEKEKFAAMGQMMAGAAHELNNPLTAILGVSDLLRERAADDATRRQVDLVLQQARRAAAIVQNLLVFSRPVTHGRDRLAIDEILEEALRLEQANFKKKNIKVKLTAPAGLPPVDGDRKLILQVFLNIILNAEQSISLARDHGTLDVSVTCTGDKKIRVTFADDGPGIPSETISKIFDPFFTTKRPGGGSGLGLTISLAVVKEHGGTIEVESREGVGATVQVVLPTIVQSQSPGAARPPAAKSIPSPADPATLRGHTVMIVEDEDGIREIVQESLSARGMLVHAAVSSEAALAYLARNSCEIIVCDLNLPGINGEKLFEELRARLGSAMPRFLFVTGELVNAEVEQRFRKNGARVLQKPFQISTLVTFLTELLQTESLLGK
jgi:PAS domain S-box-containing protein